MTKQLENNDIIHLQNAHVTQFTEGGSKGAWLVRKNITSEELFKLPRHLSEAAVFRILDFAKKFELIAFNEGIALGKKKTAELYSRQMQQMREELIAVRTENNRLADILDKHIGQKE